MKLTIRDGETRYVRYGVQDFQERNGEVEVFYPVGLDDREETLPGDVRAAIDGQFIPEDDLEVEQERTDNIVDRRDEVAALQQ